MTRLRRSVDGERGFAAVWMVDGGWRLARREIGGVCHPPSSIHNRGVSREYAILNPPSSILHPLLRLQPHQRHFAELDRVAFGLQ